MLIQATSLGRRYHRSALRRMTGLDLKTGRIFKSRNDGESPAITVDNAVGSLLVALDLAIVIDDVSGKPKKLTPRQKEGIDQTAVDEINAGGRRFHGPATKTKAQLLEAAEIRETEAAEVKEASKKKAGK